MLAMLALLGGLFIAGARDMFRAQERTPADVFWQAVQSARLQAVQSEQVVTLRYDQEARRLVWGAVNEANGLGWPGKSIEFLPVGTRDTILLGGQLVEVGALPAVRFHADGTTDRFRVQLTDATGLISILELDPWTAAPIVRSTR